MAERGWGGSNDAHALSKRCLKTPPYDPYLALIPGTGLSASRIARRIGGMYTEPMVLFFFNPKLSSNGLAIR